MQSKSPRLYVLEEVILNLLNNKSEVSKKEKKAMSLSVFYHCIWTRRYGSGLPSDSFITISFRHFPGRSFKTMTLSCPNFP